MKYVILFLCLLNTISPWTLYSQQSSTYDARYNAIKPILDRYTRPITVLDLGNNGYFSMRIARDYDATCVIIEEHKIRHTEIIKRLQNNAHPNAQRNTIILNADPSIDNLTRLGECEHFDVVLASNILARFGNDWEKGLNVILGLGDTIIIQTPWPADLYCKAGEIALYLEKQQGIFLAGASQHHTSSKLCLYRFEKNKTTFARNCWHDNLLVTPYRIISTVHEKKLYNTRNNMYSEWQRGINLTTFYFLNGTYPTNAIIRKQFSNLAQTVEHNDFIVKNLIIQGTTIVPIDFEDGRDNDQQKCLAALENLFQDTTRETLKNPEEAIQEFYRQAYDRSKQQ